MNVLDTSKPVRTRCGYPARIICADRLGLYPIIALYLHDTGRERTVHTMADGNAGTDEHPLDLVNVPESEAIYPVNPLLQLLADPSPEEFRRVASRVEEAIANSTTPVDDAGVALAIMMGMMQEVRSRVSLPLVFEGAVTELARLRAGASSQ